MNENKAGLGYQDFEEVRTGHIFYIDKTDFIREWWEYADKVTLITRPCRFGKTLNMNRMNEFMNKIALYSFSSFDIAKNASDDDAPERLALCCDRKAKRMLRHFIMALCWG